MKEKKERKKWLLIIFIVFIMIGTSVSFVFIGFSPAAGKAEYNGISFAGHGSIWIAKINGREAAFSFLPNDAESIPAPGDLFKKLQGKVEIDVTYDSNSTYRESIALAQHQMGLALAQYNVYARKGFTANNTFNLPVIKCSDATLNVPVVYFRYGNATGIRDDGNCIIAEANSNTDFIRVKDRLLYSILGVMK